MGYGLSGFATGIASGLQTGQELGKMHAGKDYQRAITDPVMKTVSAGEGALEDGTVVPGQQMRVVDSKVQEEAIIRAQRNGLLTPDQAEAKLYDIKTANYEGVLDYGQMAVEAWQNGNLDAAIKFAQQMYSYMPNGKMLLMDKAVLKDGRAVLVSRAIDPNNPDPEAAKTPPTPMTIDMFKRGLATYASNPELFGGRTGGNPYENKMKRRALQMDVETKGYGPAKAVADIGQSQAATARSQMDTALAPEELRIKQQQAYDTGQYHQGSLAVQQQNAATQAQEAQNRTAAIPGAQAAIQMEMEGDFQKADADWRKGYQEWMMEPANRKKKDPMKEYQKENPRPTRTWANPSTQRTGAPTEDTGASRRRAPDGAIWARFSDGKWRKVGQ
jgi:hypothetical protein